MQMGSPAISVSCREICVERIDIWKCLDCELRHQLIKLFGLGRKMTGTDVNQNIHVNTHGERYCFARIDDV